MFSIDEVETLVNHADWSEEAKRYFPMREHEFWFWKSKKKGKDEIALDRRKLHHFLAYHGFGKMWRGEKSLLVRTEGNVAELVTTEHIADFVYAAVGTLPKSISTDLLALLIKGANVYFADVPLRLLSARELNFKRDTSKNAFFFFKNGYVEVGAQTARIRPYSELDAIIWKSQILDFTLPHWNLTEVCTSESCDFARFLSRVTSQRVEGKMVFNQARWQALCSVVGYLLHSYNDPANTRAVILCDEQLSHEPSGRTGKGLLVQAIGKLKRTVTEDGKNFHLDSRFAFQRLSLDTRVYALDDIPKDFSFEQFFSILTEGITVERKGQTPFRIPFADAPKIVMTTNYALLGSSASHRARRHEIEFAPYYNDECTPLQDFGRRFFEEWDSEEWARFYWFMVGCVALYLQQGLLRYEAVNLRERKLIAATCEEFAQFVRTVPQDEQLDKKGILEGFHNEYLDFKPVGSLHGLTSQKMTRWLKSYASIYALRYEDGQDRTPDGKRNWFTITNPQKIIVST